MTILNKFQLDVITWDTVAQFIPLFVTVLIIWCIVFYMFHRLILPKDSKYEVYDRSRRDMRTPGRVFYLTRPFSALFNKLQSKRPYSIEKYRSATDDAISAVGSDITDIHCNTAKPIYANGEQIGTFYGPSIINATSRDTRK